MNLWLAIATGAVVGGLGAYAVIENDRVNRWLEAGRAAGLPLRIPQPGFQVQLPLAAEDFAWIDTEICACAAQYVPPTDGEPSAVAQVDPPSMDQLVDAIALCTAKRFFPSFPWPPISGDHPSVDTLWDDLHVLARRALVTQACAPRTPA